MSTSSFKQEHDLDKRHAEAARIRDKYPDRIPVIVEKAERSDIPNIDKKKYLVPADLTVGQFVYVIRKRIKLSAEKAIFIFVNNVLPPTGYRVHKRFEERIPRSARTEQKPTMLCIMHGTVELENTRITHTLTTSASVYRVWTRGSLMSAIYDERKDDDGFLYVTYSGENTFGSVENESYCNLCFPQP